MVYGTRWLWGRRKGGGFKILSRERIDGTCWCVRNRQVIKGKKVEGGDSGF